MRILGIVLMTESVNVNYLFFHIFKQDSMNKRGEKTELEVADRPTTIHEQNYLYVHEERRKKEKEGRENDITE